MKNIIKKVIQASAGTGKTYRLSLEFIGILLRYKNQEIDFNEIMVITFTKKATAEIRERILQHFDNITKRNSEGELLISNLEKILNSKISEDDILYLKIVFRKILINKNKLMISTIDSFTNSIFKSIIAPYLGISGFEIDPLINEEYLPDLYEELFSSKIFGEVKKVFSQSAYRDIDLYHNLIKTIVRNNWLFYLLKTKENISELELADLLNKTFQNFKSLLQEIFGLFFQYLELRNKEFSFEKHLRKDFFQLFQPILKNSLIEDFPFLILKFIDKEFVTQNYKILFNERPFWNGTYLMKSKKGKIGEICFLIKERYNELQESLANYLYFSLFVPEQNKIIRIADLILKKYNEIKLQHKIFTYDDISYLTFKHLYDPKISIIDNDAVTNKFYEFLSSRTRFLLIDEFQDTGILQWKILLPIIKEIISGSGQKPFGGTIIVGDEKQSIYGWRGGERELLLQAPTILNLKGKSEILSVSYRSERRVMEFINNFFSSKKLHNSLSENGIKWDYKSVTTSKQNDTGYIQFLIKNRGEYSKNNLKEQSLAVLYSEYIKNQIIPLIDTNKIDLSSTAVLARTNKELQIFSQMLNEFGIEHVLESTNSLQNHAVIKPIFFLLNFFVYADIYELIKFLRSDNVLLDTDILKDILKYFKLVQEKDDEEKKAILSDFFNLTSEISIMKRIASSYEKFHKLSLIEFIKSIYEDFNIIHNLTHQTESLKQDNISLDEILYKNTHRFFEIIGNFSINESQFKTDANGFLAYCKKNESKEEFRQIGLENYNSMQLMSIHKAKGLEFETVFYISDVSKRMGSGPKTLETYLKYSNDFSNLEEFALTFNYKKVIEKSYRQDLVENDKNKLIIEELNNLYVAITRAKKNLFLFYHLNKKNKLLAEALTKMEKDLFKKLNISQLSLFTFLEILENNSVEINKMDALYECGSLHTIDPKIATDSEVNSDINDISEFLDFSSNKKLMSLEKLSEEDEYSIQENSLKIAEEQNHKRMIGTIAHYYLSNISFNKKMEKEIARAKTISFYGGLFQLKILESIFEKVNIFISKNLRFFDEKLWTNVFNEYPMFYNNEEFRLDRILVNHEKKEVLIIDYKTGHNYQPEQLQNYIEMMKNLGFVKANKYSVSGLYLEVSIDNEEKRRIDGLTK